jgi:hypothetical protein
MNSPRRGAAVPPAILFAWTLLAAVASGVAFAQGKDLLAPTDAQTRPAVTGVRFNASFEGACLGKVEVVGPDAFRVAVPGQQDRHGRNRQTSWFYFRMDGVRGREMTVTLTDLVGEYNHRPGAVPYGPFSRPVFSTDGRAWTHADAAAVSWDEERKELTLRVKVEADGVWLAHVPPYTPADLRRLLGEVDRSPYARVEVVGRTVQGRDIHKVTVTDASAGPEAEKRCVWLQARQHAWEAGTSWVMEGALRFVTSDDPAAAELRKRVVFHFTPMVDVDGCAAGKVRFNANGFDVNRHWPEVDLASKDRLREMPEVWYTKKAIVAAHALGPPVDLLVNLHNTETAEYVAAQVDDDEAFARLAKLESLLIERTSFDPSTKLAPWRPAGPADRRPRDTTNSLWDERGIPAALIELRIAAGGKLGRPPTTEDRLEFGRGLVQAMADAAHAAPRGGNDPAGPPRAAAVPGPEPRRGRTSAELSR